MTLEDSLPTVELQRAVEAALAEDLGAGDVTTSALIPSDVSAGASIRCNASGVVAGVPPTAATEAEAEEEGFRGLWYCEQWNGECG